MFSLGLMSIIQAGFLPGFLLLRALRLTDGFLRTVVLSFGTSLLINHLVVFLLVWLHWYRPGVMYSIFAAEVAAALVLSRAWWGASLGSVFRSDAERAAAFARHVSGLPAGVRGLSVFGIVAGTVALAATTAAAGYSSTFVFDQWDAVVSWNRWATQWAAGVLPPMTWHYPQLLPTTYSLTYLFTDQPYVQFFAKALGGSFLPIMLLALADLAIRRRNAAYALAMATGAALMYQVMRQFLFAGYADPPVACYSLIGVYALMAAGEATTASRLRRSLAVAAVCAAGAASTKQAGLILAVVFPALALLVSFRGVAGMPIGRRVMTVAGACVLLAALTLPWYVYRHYVPGGSEIQYLAGPIHGGRTLAQRFAYGMGMLAQAGATPVLLYVVIPVLVAASLADRTWRWVTALLALPTFLAWGAMFSYDQRNLAMALPFVGTACAIGAVEMASWPGRLRRRFSAIPERPPVSTVVRAPRFGLAKAGVTVVAAGLLAGQHVLSDRTLSVQQYDQQRMIGDSAVNRALYEYNTAHPFDGPILSNYQILGHLPGLARWFVIEFFRSPDEVDAQVQRTNARYMLVMIHGNECIEHLDAGVREGKYRLELATSLYRLYFVHNTAATTRRTVAKAKPAAPR